MKNAALIYAGKRVQRLTEHASVPLLVSVD